MTEDLYKHPKADSNDPVQLIEDPYEKKEDSFDSYDNEIDRVTNDDSERKTARAMMATMNAARRNLHPETLKNIASSPDKEYTLAQEHEKDRRKYDLFRHNVKEYNRIFGGNYYDDFMAEGAPQRINVTQRKVDPERPVGQNGGRYPERLSATEDYPIYPLAAHRLEDLTRHRGGAQSWLTRCERTLKALNEEYQDNKMKLASYEKIKYEMNPHMKQDFENHKAKEKQLTDRIARAQNNLRMARARVETYDSFIEEKKRADKDGLVWDRTNPQIPEYVEVKDERVVEPTRRIRSDAGKSKDTILDRIPKSEEYPTYQKEAYDEACKQVAQIYNKNVGVGALPSSLDKWRKAGVDRGMVRETYGIFERMKDSEDESERLVGELGSRAIWDTVLKNRRAEILTSPTVFKLLKKNFGNLNEVSSEDLKRSPLVMRLNKRLGEASIDELLPDLKHINNSDYKIFFNKIIDELSTIGNDGDIEGAKDRYTKMMEDADFKERYENLKIIDRYDDLNTLFFGRRVPWPNLENNSGAEVAKRFLDVILKSKELAEYRKTYGRDRPMLYGRGLSLDKGNADHIAKIAKDFVSKYENAIDVIDKIPVDYGLEEMNPLNMVIDEDEGTAFYAGIDIKNPEMYKEAVKTRLKGNLEYLKKLSGILSEFAVKTPDFRYVPTKVSLDRDSIGVEQKEKVHTERADPKQKKVKQKPFKQKKVVVNDRFVLDLIEKYLRLRSKIRSEHPEYNPEGITSAKIISKDYYPEFKAFARSIFALKGIRSSADRAKYIETVVNPHLRALGIKTKYSDILKRLEKKYTP